MGGKAAGKKGWRRAFRSAVAEAPVLEGSTRASVELTLRAATLDEGARSVEAVIATEGRVKVMDWRRYEVIEEVLRAEGAELPVQVPLLDAHSRHSVANQFGSVRNLRVEGDQIIGTLYFATTPGADAAWELARGGHLTDVSGGYVVEDAVTIPRGETQVVDGREWTAGEQYPLRVTRRWRLFETSICPIGADREAKLRQEREDFRDTKEAIEMEPKKKKEAAAPDEGARQEVSPPANTVDLDAVRAEAAREAAEAERARVRAIREAAGDDIDSAVVNRAIDEGVTVDQARGLFLEHLRASRGPAVPAGSRVEVGTDGVEQLRSALENGVLRDYCHVQMSDAEAREAARWRGIGLQEMARQLCLAEGVRVGAGEQELYRSAASTQSFPLLLSNLATKGLRAAFEESPDTTEWAGERQVSDFKEYTDIKLAAFEEFKPIGHGGQVEYTEIGEQGETYRAETRGLRFVITRNQWINDDLGGFMRAPVDIGRAAKRTRISVVYNLLTSGSAANGPTLNEDAKQLFATNHPSGANYWAHADSALSVASLSQAKALMRKQKGLRGEFLNLTPAFLVVPPELEHTALSLVASTNIVVSGDTDRTLGSANIHRGTLSVVVEPRLSAVQATGWYLFASPTMAETVVKVTRRGMDGPVIEERNPRDILGMGWVVYDDFGAAAVDMRGAFRSKGAA